MNELTHLPQQRAIATHADNALTPYHDRVFHTLRTDTAGGTLGADFDYYIEQETLARGKNEITLRATIRDIRTHERLKTVVLPLAVKPVELFSPHLVVIAKAESDKRILLLRSRNLRDRFFEINMQGDGTEYNTHFLGDAEPRHQLYYLYSDEEPQNAVYYRDTLYYIHAGAHPLERTPPDFSLHRYHLRTQRCFTYAREICNSSAKGQAMIAVNPESGILWANFYGKLTQIHTADDTVIASRVLPDTEAERMENIFPTGGKSRVLLSARVETLRYYDVKTGADLFTLDTNALYRQLLDTGGSDFVCYDVDQAAVNEAETFAAVLLSGWHGRVFLIYDPENRAVILQCSLTEHHGFPAYCESKMRALGFSQSSIRKIEAAFLHLYSISPLYSHLYPIPKAAQSAGTYSCYCGQNGPVCFFDNSLFQLHTEKEGRAFGRALSVGASEETGSALLCKERGKTNGLEPATVLYSYHIPSQKLLDSMDVTGLVNTGEAIDNNFFSPALRFSGRKRPYGDKVLAAAGRNGKIQVIEDAFNITDISPDYIARLSRDHKKLFVFTREHALVASLVLDGDKLFNTARFSRREDCINVFYFNPRCMKRYNITEYADGQHTPQVVLPGDEIFGTQHATSLRESADGQYLYHLYHEVLQEDRLRIIEVETGSVLSDHALSEQGIKAARLGFIERENRFITLVGDTEITYVNPFTLDILATLQLYRDGRFLLLAPSQGGESRYFYTNAPELASVYEKDLSGHIRLLEKSDPRRRQYLQVYNSQKALHDLIYNPAQFRQEQQHLQALLHIAAADRGLPVGAVAKRIAQGETEREET